MNEIRLIFLEDMMDVSLPVLLGNKNDYKLCDNCGLPNWYERDLCVHCGVSTVFKETGEGITEYVENDYDFYMKEGYKEQEIDHIMVDV